VAPTAEEHAVADKGIRGRLVADPGLGAGNVLAKLIEHGADLDGPGLTFDVDVDGHPAWQGMPLGRLHERVTARAAWLHQRGIAQRDPVAIYVRSSADLLLNYMALTWVGAIPAFLNPNLAPDIAVEYLRRLRGVGLLTDAAGRAKLARHDLPTEILGDVSEMGLADPADAPRPYRHHAEDPIAITHSSGTTRMPTAVVHSHSSLFAATRRIRLSGPRAQGTERVLSALPAPHAAAIGALNQALCNRAELLYLSRQDDGALILDAIQRWRPTGVFGFAVTWSELARYDLSEYDLDSVALWFNTGDCAHETHIRRLIAVGSREVVTRDGVVRVAGSSFIDGIGSTEMGHSAFYITHRGDTERFGRCVGKPHVFAEVALLDAATGAEVPVGQVGQVGLKSPTVAVGYWNDHTAWYRCRMRGYYLTGDLMYRDEEGYYYHVDRAVDAVDLGDGNWLYTAMSEERVLARCADVRDCTVVAVTVDGRVTTDVLVQLVPGADAGVDLTDRVRAALTPPVAATLRRVTTVSDDEVVLGPTGKVRKFLMRQRHLAAMGGAAMGAAGT
jgi:acyl-CoA synthetase (AMP-forming)/AMP-acid ligase II